MTTYNLYLAIDTFNKDGRLITADYVLRQANSIWSQTIDGRSLKFLFFGDRDDDYYERCIDEVFNVLLNHAKEFPNDYISNRADKLPRKSREIYLLFDESAKTWKPVDIVTGILADGSDAL